MKARTLLFACFTLICGCTTVEFVRKDLAPQKQGVLRYLPTTNAEKEAKYKAKVNDQARDFCGGEFAITKEYQALKDSDVSTGVGTGVSFGMGGLFLGGSSRDETMYNFVEFVCR